MNIITAEPFISKTTSHNTIAIDTVLDLYEAICFNITTVHGYNKFNINTLKAQFLPIFTHIYKKEDNAVIIENMIRLIKERTIFMCHAIPYKYYTKIMIQ